MAYVEQSSVANVADVINRIATFAAANGWTVERNNLSGAQRTVTLCKAGVSDYIHLYNTTLAYIRMRVSVGYDGALAPNLQPNVSPESFTTLEDGPYPKLFMFASGDQVWVSLAIARNAEYRHLTFGVLEKAGVYTGGTYTGNTVWGQGDWGTIGGSNVGPLGNFGSGVASGHARVDIPDDSRVNAFYSIGGTPAITAVTSDLGVDLGGEASAMVLRADRNAFSGRSILHPIGLYVPRTGSFTYYSPLGVAQDVRLCSLNKLEPEQEITIGSDVYKIFPLVAKRPLFYSTANLPAASGDYGYAVRKVV